MNPDVDVFIKNAPKWQEELEKLRMILLDCQLTEEYKWSTPIYTYRNNNIIGINGFKDDCVLSFFKGSLLSDEAGILAKPGKNSQSARYIKFKSVQEIVEVEDILKAYVFEAMEVEKAGLKVDSVKVDDLKMPEELQAKLDEMPELNTAFKALTPGRQKAYIYFFEEPKQSKTREQRIEKYIPRILMAKGLNDCVCGLSKKMPGCDGSHKFLKQK